ncbi:hypothetical protein D3C75_882300 [compost metagenome]
MSVLRCIDIGLEDFVLRVQAGQLRGNTAECRSGALGVARTANVLDHLTDLRRRFPGDGRNDLITFDDIGIDVQQRGTAADQLAGLGLVIQRISLDQGVSAASGGKIVALGGQGDLRTLIEGCIAVDAQDCLAGIRRAAQVQIQR